MDLNALALFAKVVEAGSFSEAARRSQMPLASLSRRVAELEDELGIRLLERSTRKLRLTCIGAQLIAQARSSIELNDVVEGIVADHQSAVTGLLRVSAPNALEGLASKMVCLFQAAYPDVRVRLIINERLSDGIEDDLYFCLGVPPDSLFIAHTLFRYQPRLLASPTYLTSHAIPQTPSDLLNHSLIVLAPDPLQRTWRMVEHATGESKSLTFFPRFSLSSTMGLVSTLVAGGGIGELPAFVAEDLLERRQLLEVLPQWHLGTYDMVLLHRRNRHSPKLTQLFKEFVVRAVPSLRLVQPTKPSPRTALRFLRDPVKRQARHAAGASQPVLVS